ncbi:MULTISPECIES: hypothetical protein [Mycolicibacterium]|jgi:hypothetical protein|uniref:Uncharacterized protein n=2 Tax=Mycolicibacterium TaxID=1866885 RepID=A0A7I7ZRS0_9MYCO|nr:MULTISPECIES: hypothetical protein [Mycolicibacterium]OBA87803.1 hypothetical protein A5642_18760 [Mycolicibacterium mucogenicum]TLH74432.1 hypothetical protein C1S79_02965 [Mycolicibacterium phocaicum]BBZ56037.1 hypothetical protein MPHO_30290 [Mycolicibacterium phocaicum]
MTDENQIEPCDLDQSDHHKHMDFVQAIITRLANNSFLLKGWTLTLASAVLGLAITQKHAGLALAALVPVAAFWLLDTYYLRQERAFRDMYVDIAAKRVRDFKIESKPYAEKQPWRKAAFSVSLGIYYGTITGVTVVVAAILAIVTAAPDQRNQQAPAKPPPTSSTTGSPSPITSPRPIPQRPDESPPHTGEPPATPEPKIQEAPTAIR